MAGSSMLGVPPAGGMHQQGSFMGASFNYAPPQSFANHWYGALYNQMSHAELSELRKWFMAVDRDRSGGISAYELQNLAFGGKPLGFPTAAKLVKVFDKDGSLNVEFHEYAVLHKFISNMQSTYVSLPQVEREKRKN
jgi:Ca2+-binding EF-hand superfamily protein